MHTRSRAGCSTTSRRSCTGSASRSRSSSRRSSAEDTCCSRTCREPRRPCWRGRSRSRSRARTSSRIQCTPDLQPTDVTGLSIFNQRERDFEFRPGPVFANVVLVDEINRAMPKTQSALLEAMAEQQVTVDGVTRPLAEPVPRHRDPEPDRVRRHVPAARGAARPLLRPHDARLSGRGGREPDRGRAARRPPADAAASPPSTSPTSTTMSAAVREVFVHDAVAALDRRPRAGHAPSWRWWRSAARCAARSRSTARRVRGRC